MWISSGSVPAETGSTLESFSCRTDKPAGDTRLMVNDDSPS